ncbi:DUF4625 domain-containing protein [Parapedobacter sp. ISTM3]|uniref:DUF4625 domain-containing protein n=1 Tax=Parapedobacter luteus TaxID=623280 RepID=A0A1T5CVT3_9SPHI|nr:MULTISPECIES: DUF4625 domain-containing protein [Parapedobacter]MBK1440697.1 DUF4625 domain-containing protein [Parapedobacter sp. ISTM3]SKB63451.1 protein of unknown function [Parapedobacter luteus]
MKRIVNVFVLLSVLLSCSKDSETTDTEYPEIDMAYAEAFPVQCSTIRRGETFVFRALFSDNVALGSFSLDVHHNFDHHTHSTEVNDCGLDPVKTPETPFVYIRSFDIPGGPQTYEARMEIAVPADVDPGDYHFMIRVTDREGWQTMKGLSIKIQ